MIIISVIKSEDGRSYAVLTRDSLKSPPVLASGDQYTTVIEDHIGSRDAAKKIQRRLIAYLDRVSSYNRVDGIGWRRSLNAFKTVVEPEIIKRFNDQIAQFKSCAPTAPSIDELIAENAELRQQVRELKLENYQLKSNME